MQTLGYLGSKLNPEVNTLRPEETLPQKAITPEVCTAEITPVSLLRKFVTNKLVEHNPDFAAAPTTDMTEIWFDAQFDQYWQAYIFPDDEDMFKKGQPTDIAMHIWAYENGEPQGGDVYTSLDITGDGVKHFVEPGFVHDLSLAEIYGLYLDLVLAETTKS